MHASARSRRRVPLAAGWAGIGRGIADYVPGIAARGPLAAAEAGRFAQTMVTAPAPPPVP